MCDQLKYRKVNTNIHCIIWTGEDNFSSCVRSRNVCKNSRMKFEFDQLNDRGTISNVENMHRKDRDACIIQTHDCGHSVILTGIVRSRELEKRKTESLFTRLTQYSYKLHRTIRSDDVCSILTLCDLATAQTE